MLKQLKAIAAGVVALAATWLASKYGFAVSAEVQAAIVGAVLYAVTYMVPNLKSA